MKATSRFKSAASAAAISAGLILSGAGALQFVGVTQAVAAVVSNISVQGNERVEAQTIRDYIGIVPGRNFTNADIDEAVKRLFETGLFSDVRVSQSGSTLVVQVTEYAIVNQVVFRGNRRVRDNQLTTATQLQPRRAFSQAALDADIEAIRAAYQRVGRGDVVIRPEVVNLGANRVNIVYDIQEGGRTRISSITFSGNTAFSDGRLREVITTKRSHILSWLTRNDIYDEDRLRADEEALRTFYYNRGYADFQVISAVGELDEARNEYNINFTVNEGERYSYGSIEIDSTIPGVDGQALRRLLEVREGRTYRAREVENSLVALTEHLAGMGYAFAQVTPRGDRDFTNRTISIVFQIDQGPRAYVERIEIRGNARTRDYVIRREFDLVEGDAFNQVLVQRAARRLRDLDFFETVNVSTAPGSEADQVVLIVEVVEKATGEFSLGAGYTTGQSTAQSGFSVEGAIAERNFLGRGQSIRVSAGGGQRSRDFAFSFTEPYFLGQRISAGFDIFRSTRQFDKYNMESTGGTVRFGLPITQALTANLAYNFVQDQYRFRGPCLDANGDPIPNDSDCNIAPILADAIQNQSPWTRSSVSAGLTYNTIDNMRDPRTGIFANVNTEVAGVGGDARFVKFTARGQYYHLLQEEMDLVGVLTAGGGHVSSIGGGGLRVFDLFNSSERIIRGFDYNGIGPRQGNDHLGGTTYFHGSAELQFPFPAVPRDFGLRGAIFADAATLYGSPFVAAPGDPALVGTSMAWRASVGVGLMWASPFGPLRLDYAFPVVKQTGDRVQNFSFGVSTRF